MTTGLTLGKYAPLHQGHQLVIEAALAECDEAIALIYDAPETTDIPLGVRAGWLRALYPSLRVIEAWDGPTEVGYTDAVMRRHERYVSDALARRGVGAITRFYSSEPYGAHMSRALGAEDRRVDEARRHVPISATAIRGAPYEHRAFVPPLVYRDLIVHVALLGAPSTGKTTLAERLAAELDTVWMPEYGRAYWEAHQVERRLTPAQLVEIAEGHIEREDALAAEANRYLIADTNAMTTATFARYYHDRVPARLEALADRAARRYDLVFVCDTDIPYDDTWDRSGAVQREAFQRQVLGDLAARQVPYVVLRGDVDARVRVARRILEHFRKFMNPFELAQALARVGEQPA